MTALRNPGVDIHTSNADQDGQYLLRVYRDGHGTTRTVAWRQSTLDTWGPEHVLFAEPIAEGLAVMVAGAADRVLDGGGLS